MATIEEIKQQYPDLNGLDDDQVVGALHKAFYADLPRELVAKSLGVKPQPVIDKNAPGQLRSGFNRSFAEVPGLAAGSAAYVADVVGADETRDKLLDYAKKSSDEVQAAHQGDAASITDAWDGKTSWSDFLKNATGYVAGQALQGIATGGFGALGAKMLATQGIKTAAERTAAEFIAKGATQEVATAAATEAAKSYAAKMAVRGAIVGAGGQNLNMELGSIYPDAVDEATSHGRTLDGGDKFRVGASALAAAGVDTAAEAITASRVFRGSKVGQGATKPPTVLGSEMLGRAVREVPAGMVREGGTEGVQTVLEHYGAGQPIADEKGVRDIVDSMGTGAVGGILGGAGASFHSRKVEEVGPLSRAANAGMETAVPPPASPALQIGNTPDPYLSFADGTVARKSEIDTYINSLPPEQQPAARAKVMGLAPQPSIPQAEPVTPAQAMGIDPAAGPLSAAAAIAVDTGTTQEIQRNQASEADQAAYDEATAAQEQQAAQQAQQQDSAVNPITTGPIAEAAMSPDDKRAMLFSNQTVVDGGVQYTGTQDGDILNGLGKPYATRMAAQRRVTMEGKDWMVAPVFDGFVARRKDALNGTTDATSAVDQGADAGASDQPTGSGTNSLAEPVPGTDGAGSLPAAPVGRSEPDNPVVDAGNSAAAVEGSSHVQDETPAAQPAPTQAPGETAPAVAGDATATEGLPGSASAAVEAPGVATTIDKAAHEAATSPKNDLPQPTDGQKEAGNYPKGHVNLNGLDLAIENPAGSVRSGVNKDGKPWSNTLQHHYGYIKGTIGNDKDHVDLFVKPGTPLDYSGNVYVVNQIHPHNGKFDEHKVVVGAKTGMEARRIYHANYAKDWKGFQSMTAMPFDQFKTWVKDGQKNQPLAPEQQVSQPQGSNHAETSETQQVEPQQKAPERAAGKQVAPKLTARAKIEQAKQARADYFTPGNIVQGYGGHDEVLSYHPGGDGKGWSVKVRAVIKQDGKWVQDPTDKRERVHSTQPDARELKAGPVERSEVPEPSAKNEAMIQHVLKADAESAAKVDEAMTQARKRQGNVVVRDGKVYRLNLRQLHENGRPTPADDQVHVSYPGTGLVLVLEDGIRMDAPAAQTRINQVKADGFEVEGSTAPEAATTPEPQSAPAKVEPAQPSQQEAAKEVSAEPPAEPAQSIAQPAVKPASKIEDSGAVLEGARKLYAKAYAAKLDEGMGMDIAAVPLSKSWPEPDYQRMLDDGADPWAVAFAHAARDEVPNKPSQLAWKVKGWVDKVQVLRDLASLALDGKHPKEVLQEKGNAFHLMDWFNKVDLYEAVGHANSLKGVTFSVGQYSMYGGQTFSPAKTLWAITEPSKSASATWSHGNWGNELAVADTKAEAIAKYQAYLATHNDKAPAATKATSFDIYSYGKVPGFIVGKRLSATKSIDLKTFPTIKEARAYKANNQAELEKLLEAAKVELPERRDTNAPRIGTDYRNGSDVTTEQFRDAFGFRGEQFGASMPQGERQSNLNQAYDALMDLAGVIGIPPKALSLNGELGLAFGARGTGGIHPAAAHYEKDTTGSVTPNRVVINLTRKNGAGSLAHEWFHAVDNYFARLRGEKAGMLTDNPNISNDGVRPEMVDAFKKLKTTIGLTGLQERSKQLDKKRVKDYWSTGTEMAARSFESYVIAKLQDQSASNDYLANIVDETVYAMQSAYPYPSMGEIPAIRTAFDHFFDTVQTKETEQGTALFSRSTDTVNPGGQPAARAQALVDAITARWKNAPKAVVVQSLDDQRVPEKDRKNGKFRKFDESGNFVKPPDGFFDKDTGTVYLIADKMAGDIDVVRVLMHESLGHFGLRGLYGAELGTILDRIAVLNAAKVKNAAKRLGLDFEKPSERRLATEEVLAYMAQETPELGWVKRTVAAVRAWMRQHIPGFGKMQLSDDELIRDYIIPARQFVEDGSSQGGKSVASEAETPFSRNLGDALTSGLDAAVNGRKTTIASYTQHATDKLNETFSHPGKLNWWHKSFGTMNNLAERSPAFKPVFKTAQDFIDDTSYYATEAADMAPHILPKLEKWADLTKSPITAADNKAVSAPIFEGTLSWARDESSKPVRLDDLEATYAKLDDDAKAQMLLKKHIVTDNELKRWKASPLDIYTGAVRNRFKTAFLTAGVVWSPAELKSMFKLTGERRTDGTWSGQIGLYREFRSTVDKSLDNLAKADLLRFGGKDVAMLQDQVMDSKDADEAAVLLRDYLHSQRDLIPERADDLTAAASGMIDRADKVAKLKAQGYAPLSRFGKYTVDVVVNGERQYFSLFETARDANQMAAKMRMAYGAAAVGQGTLSESEFKLFAGVTPESLELFGNMLGLDSTGDAESDKAFQTYLKLTKTNRSAMRRMIHRKGIAGFSEDAGRVLASFVYSNARQTSAALHMGALGEAVNNIPKNQGELKDAAIALADYIKNPQEEAQAIRGLLFTQYLGGSLSSAFVNMTQPFAVTFPWLSQYGGAKQSGTQLLRAMKEMADNGTVWAPDLAKALKHAEENGIVSPQEVHQLLAQARGAGTLKSGDGTRTGDAMAIASNAISKLSLGWGKVFGMAEQLNRRSTFIAAYRVAQAQKMKDPAAFAERAVNETQFIYSKANKMKFGRGAIGGTLMTFKTYSVAYLELLSRMATQGGPEGKKAVVLALAVMMLMSGSGGLPFMEDITDLVDGLLQRLGYNVSSKKAKQQFLEDLFGKTGADFVDRGISGLPGMPADVTGRLGMSHIAPGIGLFQSKSSHASDLGELVGPAGDLFKRAFDASGKLLGGDIGGAALAISPVAVRNAFKGADMASTGMYRDAKGYKVLDTTMLEAALKSIGFQPETVANIQEANYINQKAKNFYAQTASEIRSEWAKGIFEKDQDQINAARARMQDWNEKNPDQRMKVNMPAVLKHVMEMRKPKDQRVADTAPKAMRAQMRRELAQAHADAM